MPFTEEDKKWLEARFEGQTKSLEARFEVQTKWLEARFDVQTKSLEARFEAQTKWLESRLEAQTKWLESRLDVQTRETRDAIEATETKLLTEFHKWASPMELRVQSHATAIRAIDLELENVKERVSNLEPRQ